MFTLLGLMINGSNSTIRFICCYMCGLGVMEEWKVNIEKELQYLKEVAAEYAKHKAHAEYLKEFRKSKKAMLINEAAKNGHKTAQERESYAYSHEEYLCLLDGLKVATEESERLRIMVKTCELQIDSKKTQQMRDMAEMKLR